MSEEGERKKMTGDEISELVKEYELLGSREAREEALEYMRFLQEELGRGLHFGQGTGEG